MSDRPWLTYSFSVVHVVPHVQITARIPVGVIVHARTADFLDMQVIDNLDRLRKEISGVDHELLLAYLVNCRQIAKGDVSAGVIALSPISERFHWLTAPRSDVIQTSPIHEGVTLDPKGELDRLFRMYISDHCPA